MTTDARDHDAPPELPGHGAAVAQALALVPGPDGADLVALDDAAGRVLRSAIVADRDLPPFDRATMDGYALRARDLARAAAAGLPVAGDVAAGAAAGLAGREVPEGACVAIATGAPVPPGLDCVVPHERTDRGDPVRVRDADGLGPGHAIHPRASDAPKDAVLVPPGTRLGAATLGVAAACGVVQVAVARPPRVVLVTGGDEVVAPDETPGPTQVRDVAPALVGAIVARVGARMTRHERVRDDRAAIDRLLAAVLPDADVLVTVGGVSAGVRDHVPDALEALGTTWTLAGAAIQPGRPIRAGRIANGPVVVCLPGNPVSVLACANLFLRPVLERRLGVEPAIAATPGAWPRRWLAAPVRPNPRREAFRPAIETARGVVVPPWSGSGDLVHAGPTDGLVALPRQAEEVAAGTPVAFLPWA